MAKRRRSSKSSSGVPAAGSSSAKIGTKQAPAGLGSAGLGLNSPGATKSATRYQENTTPRAARRRSSK